MKSNKKVRLTISIVLFFIMVATAVYLYQNKDELFTSTSTITYPDKCIEVFKNDELTTEECTYGRLLMEEQNQKSNGSFNYFEDLEIEQNEEWIGNLNLT